MAQSRVSWYILSAAVGCAALAYLATSLCGEGTTRPHPVARVPTCDDQTVPRGRIAFEDRAPEASSGISVVSTEGEIVALSRGDDRSPLWSPAGDTIAFWRVEARTAGGRQLWQLHVAILGIGEVADAEAGVFGLPGPVAWSLENQLAFAVLPTPEEVTDSSLAEATYVDLYIADADFAHVEHLGKGTSAFAWSPDATRIAYQSGASIIVMTLGLGGKSEAAQLPRDERGNVERVEALVWTPDGAAIMYRTESSELIRARADGSGGEEIVKGLGREWTLSPDGKRLAYISEERLRILDMDANVVWANGVQGNFAYLRWAPDSTRLVFWLDGDIYSVKPDGSDLTLVAADAWLPAWSPDSTSLLFMKVSESDPLPGPYKDWEEPSQIWVSDRDGCKSHPVAHNRAFSPVWGP